MRKAKTWLVVLSALAVIVIGAAIYRHAAKVNRQRVEQREGDRLWELRAKKRDYDNYWRGHTVNSTAPAPPVPTSNDMAELAELERREAKRAADRLADQ